MALTPTVPTLEDLAIATQLAAIVVARELSVHVITLTAVVLGVMATTDQVTVVRVVKEVLEVLEVRVVLAALEVKEALEVLADPALETLDLVQDLGDPVQVRVVQALVQVVMVLFLVEMAASHPPLSPRLVLLLSV